MDGAVGSTVPPVPTDPGNTVAPNTGHADGPADGAPPAKTSGAAAPSTGHPAPPATPPPRAPTTRGSGATFKRATTDGGNDWNAWWSWNSEPYLRTGLVASFAATPG